MNEIKKQNRRIAKDELLKAGIKYQSLNNDLHWKVGSINFFPTTGRWTDEQKNESGQGLKSFIRYIKINYGMIEPESEWKKINSYPNQLTVEQLFQIAAHSKDKSLEGICKEIHKEVYK